MNGNPEIVFQTAICIQNSLLALDSIRVLTLNLLSCEYEVTYQSATCLGTHGWCFQPFYNCGPHEISGGRFKVNIRTHHSDAKLTQMTLNSVRVKDITGQCTTQISGDKGRRRFSGQNGPSLRRRSPTSVVYVRTGSYLFPCVLDINV